MNTEKALCGCDGCYYQDDIYCPGWDERTMKLKEERPCLIDGTEYIFVLGEEDEDD